MGAIPSLLKIQELGSKTKRKKREECRFCQRPVGGEKRKEKECVDGLSDRMPFCDAMGGGKRGKRFGAPQTRPAQRKKGKGNGFLERPMSPFRLRLEKEKKEKTKGNTERVASIRVHR